MQSLQSILIEAYLRIKGVVPPSVNGEIDVPRERAETELLAEAFGRLKGAECVPVVADDVPAEWILPAGLESRSCVLYLHGGTFFAGSIQSHRPLAAAIASAARARALLPGYRLAPEHPFPAGLQDVISAYEWLLEDGIPPERIAIVGDSAGGGLVFSLLLWLRDHGLALPACAVCLSPWVDLTLSGETWRINEKKDVMLQFWNIRKGAEMYLNGTDPRDPLASPLFAELGGLPPLLIQVGTREMILSDSTRIAEKARAAGVDVTLEIWEGMQHEWQFASSIMPEGRRAVERIGDFIRGHCEGK
jgi:acetyl esterase/lipase